ncbi:C13 family peptidase [uncultured Alcanivorax sp.]|jgi:hypothetical protein|uniref:C13 family peptidase n=1 Tax=uncultured Alcanivorax sp. TaxID=191215 RepID=UPI0026380DAD|nr:C13 family peptidase [uncultured Alcanivorax sp.]
MRNLCLLVLLGLLSGCEPVQLPADVRMPDGAVYDGDTEDNLFHGQGSLTWPDGRHYEGEFQEGLMTGEGRLEGRDGCVQEGHFVNGVLNGEGSYTCPDASYQGQFTNGELTKGSVAYLDDNSYQGEFRDFQPHGQGLWVTASAEQFEGTFAEGYMVKGTYRNEEGYHYQGEFDFFTFEGKGELTRPDGVVIRATFENGHAEGPGTRTRPRDEGEPVVEKGFFVRGDYYPSEKAWRQRKQQQAAAMEARLYTESSRLQSVLSSLAPQRPGVRDVYLLVVGGDGTEAVFAREVDWVAERLGSVFDLKRRHVRLINGGSDELPLATRTSVQESLKALDALLDPEEDLLLVHFVSHGSPDGDLLLDDKSLKLNNLTVADGKQWLNGLSARHQWVIVSACYSGKWVEGLATPERVVFSSAAADRTSFGCGDDSERTWFSKALYGEAMAAGVNDPQAWFDAANEKVSLMEKEQGIEGDAHSQPQKSVGGRFLRWWQADKAALVVPGRP